MKDRLPRRAWAVLETTGDLASHDSRLPLFWYREQARQFAQQHVVEPWRVVRVTVAAAPTRKRRTP